MLLEELDWTRVLLVLFFQTFIAVVFLFLSYSVLRRHKTRISIICSGIFISVASAFIVNLIYFSLRINPVVLILHMISILLIFFGLTFVLLFLLNLLKSKFEFTLKKQIIIFIIYGIVSFLLLMIPGGITINDTTDWRPLYSYLLFIILLIYATVALIIPSFIFSIRIYKSFEDEVVMKKWRYYLLGYSGFAFEFYGLMVYNTLTDPMVRVVWSIISAVILITSGILMYLGIGRQLQK